MSAGTRPGSTVCILSWNGRSHLEHCLEALAQQHEPDGGWEVLVLDNGSSDGTIEWLEREWENRALGARGGGRLRWIRRADNSGFCAGNNQLADAAQGEHLVLLNNDTRPRRDWLAALSAAMRAAPADVAAVGGRILDWDERRVDFVEGLLTFDGHAFQRGYGRDVGAVEEPAPGAELLFACGGNMIVRREAFREVGAFDPAYFAYLEDVDLGWRLWSAGHRVTYQPQATVAHRSMATSGALGTYNRGLLFERNALRTAFKNFDDEHWNKLASAVWTTFLHRTQTMLVENNPGGAELALDPYQDAAAPTEGRSGTDAAAAAEEHGPSLVTKWRGWGTFGLARRGLRRLLDNLADSLRRPGDPRWELLEPLAAASEGGVALTDPRSVAQLRAFAHFARHLGAAAGERRRIQGRRMRGDREIFERFGLHLVPTYPGDDRWFADPGFRSLLPARPRLVERTLDQLMA
ncbi:MAG: glycosyltransferase family 2 protein [Acidobacteria bacterium]|nr:MAG: glycosyltransferase family 2 protein [Acidobacteriota bacterium]REK05641.1 MAG: glycosyltransferase family 2 protein [Acidobacteriota bacterium]